MNRSTTCTYAYLPPHTHGTRRDAAPRRRCPSAAKKPVATSPRKPRFGRVGFGLVVVDAVVVEKIVGIVVEVVDPRVVGVGFERERGESRSRAFLP